MEKMISEWLGSRWLTPLGRFYQMCVTSTLPARRRTGTDSVSEGSETDSIFPMPLPFTDVLTSSEGTGTEKSFAIRRERKKIAAQQMTNLLVTVANFFELGCPRGGPPLVFASGELNSVQAQAAQRFFNDAEFFCAHSGGPVPFAGRGRARLNDMILSLGSRYSESGTKLKSSGTVTVA